jgi:hypothetical protein
LRYDGPIPSQYLETDLRQRRRRRGTLAVFESQAAQFLDAAERCQNDMEDLTAELAERRLTPWQREVAERRLLNLANRADAHIRAALEAFGHAIPLRRQLGLRQHPTVAAAGLLAALPETTQKEKQKQ